MDPTVRSTLEQLAQDYRDIGDTLNQAPDRLRGAYEIAHDTARQALIGCLESEELQTEVQADQARLDADIATIQELIDKGLLTDVQGREQAGLLMRHEDYQFLRLAKGLGKTLLCQTVALVVETPVEPDTESSPPESAKSPIAVPETSIDDASVLRVVIAARGLVIDGRNLFFARTMHSVRDERIAFLRAIAALELGATMKPRELWQRALPDTAFTREKLSSLVDWAEKNLLSPLDGAPLLSHNDKRGPASRYVRSESTQLVVIDESEQSQPSDSVIDDSERYTKAPTADEAAFMAMVVRELATELDEELGSALRALDAVEELDLRTKTEAEIKDLRTLALFKIKKICNGEETRDVICHDAAQQPTMKGFLDSVMPILEHFKSILEDDNMLEQVADNVIQRQLQPASV